MKRALCIAAVIITCGCGQSAFRFRADVNRDIAAGDFASAASRIEAQKGKIYRDKDSILFNLDLGAVRHDGGAPDESDRNFASAQQQIDDYVTSVSQSASRVVKNDLTVAYQARDYERSMTFVYRALNFLDQGSLQGALVEARKAVFFLGRLRRSTSSGYNDDPFVQYFASLLFESGGFLSDARISRANSLDAYARFAPFYNVPAPDFNVPSNAGQMGEIVFVHYNGVAPLLASQTMQVAWGNAMLTAGATSELYSEQPAVQNALLAGFTGNAITVAYPVVVQQRFFIRSSSVEVDGTPQDTVLVHDISALVRQDLSDRMPGIMARVIARAVMRQVLNNTTRNAVSNATKDENLGNLAGMLFSAFAAAAERADTRLWFTLPAEIRMARVFVPPGRHRIIFRAFDANGALIETQDLGEVDIQAGARIYLHTRTGK